MGNERQHGTPVKISTGVKPRLRKVDSGPKSTRRERTNGTGAGRPTSSGTFPDLSRIPVQPALEIGAPDDEYEKEADRVADQVMRMPAPEIRTKPS